MKLLRTVFMLGLALPGPAQAQRDSIPAEVRRRIAQAVWPENLFDSLGRPESGFVRRAFRPAYHDLLIHQALPIPDLPGVTVWMGDAYPSGCSHCGTTVRGVARRGAMDITLMEPEDLELLAAWVDPPFEDADTVRVRQFVLNFLRSTCFLGCEVQLVSRSDSADPDLQFFRAAKQANESVTIPRMYSHVSSAGLTVEFPLRSLNAIYRIRAERNYRGIFSVSVTPVAYHMGP
jgi:hypothetical protein